MNELVQRAQQDHNAFGELYEATISALFRYCMVLTSGNEDLSWDICSETYMKALRMLSSYKDQGYHYTSYLYRIARNTYIDELRKRKKEQHLMQITIGQHTEDLVASDEDMPDSLLRLEEEDIERAGFLLQIREHIQTLKEDERELIYMRFEQEMKYQEIAHVLGSPVTTIKVRYHRLYKKLSATFASLHPHTI